MPIIQSLLDLDLYKLTVGNLIFNYFPDVMASYQMTVRNADRIDFWKYVLPVYDFRDEVNALEELSLSPEEAAYLRSLNLFSESYIKFLSDKSLKPQQDIRWVSVDGDIAHCLPQASGPWHRVMLYETLCLSIGNHIYAEQYTIHNQIPNDAVFQTARTRLYRKCDVWKAANAKFDRQGRPPIRLTEFGTRRRLHRNWQEEAIDYLKNTGLCNSTSNVRFAFTKDLAVRGTFGHEWVMGFQGLTRIQDSQKEAFQLWLEYYGDKLNIALTDTLGDNKFIRDFRGDLVTRFAGLRHDSGNPFAWGKRMIQRYIDMGIDPKTKTLMFSDGLDIPLVIWLNERLGDEINVVFGVGTNLTNDTFIPVPNSVMKMTYCNGQPVAKLSAVEGKATSPCPEYLAYVKWAAENL